MQDQNLANASQNVLTSMAAHAERDWKDFSGSTNGQTLLASTEIPVEQRIKTAFILGAITSQMSVMALFIQGGMNANLLPHRRIVWKTPENLKLEPGKSLENLVFISQLDAGGFTVHMGKAECHIPHPELLAPADAPMTDTPAQAPRTDFYNEHGQLIRFVVAWVEEKEVLATFAH